jgi:hypothetical protein
MTRQNIMVGSRCGVKLLAYLMVSRRKGGRGREGGRKRESRIPKFPSWAFNDLTSFHQAPPPKGCTIPQKHDYL